MSKLKKMFSDETSIRITKLENELEEFKKNITEENLRLKTPYVTDINKQHISLSISDAGRLCVHLNSKIIGEILLNQEETI